MITLKNVFKILFKVILILLIFVGAWSILTPVFRYDESNEGNQFRNLPEDILDIIVLGSSHAQYSMNPAVIYTESGYYSYVLGSGCQPMSMSYHFLVEALKTQSPEVVLLDVFTMMPARSVCYGDGMYYNAIQQMTGLNRIQAAFDIENDEKKMDYAFDLLMNHDKWKQDDFLKTEENENRYNDKLGYVAQQPQEYVFNHLLPMQKGETDVQFRESDITAFENIIDLCQKENIKLILFKSAVDIDQENYDYLQAIWELADEKGIEHVDFLALAEEIGFTLGMDGDTWHNNTWGAQKTSKYIANYIKENNYVTKHQDNEIYIELVENLCDDTVEWLFENNVDIYQLLDYASKYDLNMIVKYTGSNSSSIGEYENQALQATGINFDFINDKDKNYYALISNGKVVESSNQPFTTTLNGIEIQIGNEIININDRSFNNLGELELIFFDDGLEWINEMPIDYATRYFWKNGCESWNCEI